jgi:1-acyl-sn-glycerol-3-phosphate acyltransferase
VAPPAASDLSLVAHVVWRVSCRAQGQEHIRRDATRTVYVVNHQSTLDMAVLSPLHMLPFRVIIKAELLFYPILGQAMWLAGYIPVWRGNKDSGRAALERARQAVAAGGNVLFFPEGTRKVAATPEAPLGDFKIGAFKLASEVEGCVIQPITVSGARHLFPLSAIPVLEFGEPVLTVHPPIPCAGKTPDQLSDECRAVLVTALRDVDTAPVKGARGGAPVAHTPAGVVPASPAPVAASGSAAGGDGAGSGRAAGAAAGDKKRD